MYTEWGCNEYVRNVYNVESTQMPECVMIDRM